MRDSKGKWWHKRLRTNNAYIFEPASIFEVMLWRAYHILKLRLPDMLETAREAGYEKGYDRGYNTAKEESYNEIDAWRNDDD